MAGVKIPAAVVDRARFPQHTCHININHLFSFAFTSIPILLAPV
jgi:hypothetical protein